MANRRSCISVESLHHHAHSPEDVRAKVFQKLADAVDRIHPVKARRHPPSGTQVRNLESLAKIDLDFHHWNFFLYMWCVL